MATYTNEQLNAMIEENNQTFTATWAGGEMNVRRRVDFKTLVEIVSMTVEACFDDLGAYLPEAKAIVMWSYIVDKYTDVELPDDIEARANVLIYTDLSNAIRECVDVDQIFAIEDAVDKRIKNSIDAGNNVLMNGVMNTYASLAAIHSEMENALKQIGGVEPAKFFNVADANNDEAKS